MWQVSEEPMPLAQAEVVEAHAEVTSLTRLFERSCTHSTSGGGTGSSCGDCGGGPAPNRSLP